MNGMPAVRALLLLAGGSRRPELAGAGRSPLELPLDSKNDILGKLLSEIKEVAQDSREGARLIVGEAVSVSQQRRYDWLQVESDTRPLRGTGGVLRDTTQIYDDGDIVVVGNAMQYLAPKAKFRIDRMRREISEGGFDVAIGTDASGTAMGFLVLRCVAVRGLAEEGFVDLKEQALPALAKRHRVSVIKFTDDSDLPIRTRLEYLSAVRHTLGFQQASDPLAELDPYLEAGNVEQTSKQDSTGRSLIEPDATIEPGAKVIDSVILAGAKIERGASVVRSVVGEGILVRSGTTVRDVVLGNGARGTR